MAYNELIKNFNRIRDYMREFYVYGFKRRGEYTIKSARSYDNEKRRMESLLGDYMKFRKTSDGKNVFLSIDSRVSQHNPLYKAWKAKSFTDGDITLHFVLLDILASEKEGIVLSDIVGRVYDLLPDTARVFDESTIRKKLKEYLAEGIVRTEKKGRTVRYYLKEITDINPYVDILDFFSEIAPCGVVGAYLLDQADAHDQHFAFKHHYITGALDSEILYLLFGAMKEKRSITIEIINRHKDRVTEHHVVPLRIMFSVQSGRQYLMAYVPRFFRISSFRLDNIRSVKSGEDSDLFDYYRQQLDKMQQHMWGVSTQSRFGNRMEHVDFTVTYKDDEQHIPKRLEREKRCGTVEHIDKNTSRFSADVYDATELIPWMRTFICRITDFYFSDEKQQKQFSEDLNAMYQMYGIREGGEENTVQ